MTFRDLLMVAGLWVLSGAVMLLVVELRLRHHLGRLGSLGESVDGIFQPLKAKIESLEGKFTELRREHTRAQEGNAEVKAKVEILFDSHERRHLGIPRGQMPPEGSEG